MMGSTTEPGPAGPAAELTYSAGAYGGEDFATGEPVSDAAAEAIDPIDPAHAPISLPFADEDALLDAAGRDEAGRMPRSGFARHLCERITAGVEGRRAMGRDDRIRAWRNQYESVKRRKNYPWPGAANLHIPLSRTHADTIHAHLFGAIASKRPYFKAELDPDTPDGYDPAATMPVARKKERALDAILRGKLNFRRVMRKGLRRAIVDGNAPLVIHWDVRVEKVRERVQVTPGFIERLQRKLAHPEPRVSAPAASVLEQIEAAGAEEGDWLTVAREKVTYDAARVDLIDILDFGVYPAASPTLDDAQVIFWRCWYTADQLRHGVKSGQFDADEVEELAQRPPSGPGRHDDTAGGDRARVESSGVRAEGEIDDADRAYECFHVLVRHDADGDGLSELCFCVVAMCEGGEGRLLRAQIFPYYHGQPNVVLLGVFERDGFLYDYSLMEMLEDVQAEANTLRNQRVDNGTIRNVPVLVASRSLKWDPSKNPLTPGMVILADDPEKDLRPLTFGAPTQDAFAEEESVKAIAREVAGVNEIVLGQTGGSQSTLGELDRALQATNTKFETLLDYASECFEVAVSQIDGLYRQYTPPEGYVYNEGSTRAPSWQTISREEMVAPSRFVVHATAALSNKVLQAQLGEKVKMLAERSPFTGESLVRMHAAEAYVYDAWEIPEWERFIGTEEEAAQLQEAKAEEPPPGPETRISVSERRDEVLSLSLAIKKGEITPEEYLAAALLAAQAAQVMPAPAPGADVSDSTDDAAGNPPGAESPDTPGGEAGAEAAGALQ